MAILLIVLGIIVWILVSPLIGLIMVLLGVVLFFVSAVPYGYHSYRRGPP